MRSIGAGARFLRIAWTAKADRNRTMASRNQPAGEVKSCARQIHMETLVVYDKPSNGHHSHAEPDGGQHRWCSLADAGRHMEQGTLKINAEIGKAPQCRPKT
ncbi:hypothetical protein [Rhizobium sp. Root483D2]|uniref:hypothetical protein n=1 Tax=Rhizobium sp. Root483D2 TaxID=1736545 RepID=UPI0012E34C02|nr:hypothetical protein [Rhizobium sp. Root483D2]